MRLEMEGLKKVFPFLDLPHRRGQGVGGALFDQVSGRAQGSHLLDISVIFVCGEDEDPGGGDRFEDLPGGFQPIEQGHGDVHYHDGGAEFPGPLDRLAPVVRLANHLNVPLSLQQRFEPFADDRMVFRQQDCDVLPGYGDVS